MKQYANYRKEQVSLIREKTDKIKNINNTLVAQRNTKNQVLEEQRQEQATLETEKKELEVLATNIRAAERNYEAQIREKQKQANAIDREIQRLIRLAIIEANKREKERLAALNRGKNAPKTTSSPSSGSNTEIIFCTYSRIA
ncbi:Membrane-bound metallopeptidase [Capnocytophaga ochracea]|uniref:Membrane-bound metallopeptidase n=1 Tax=Capnocytophaga ochracea TaxID=1018 RepID=A0A2X1H2H9_CAPOC|nr:Membrane-bound metallopeptidase [Capnocytophaga ochracea]